MSGENPLWHVRCYSSRTISRPWIDSPRPSIPKGGIGLYLLGDCACAYQSCLETVACELHGYGPRRLVLLGGYPVRSQQCWVSRQRFHAWVSAVRWQSDLPQRFSLSLSEELRVGSRAFRKTELQLDRRWRGGWLSRTLTVGGDMNLSCLSQARRTLPKEDAEFSLLHHAARTITRFTCGKTFLLFSEVAKYSTVESPD